MTSHDDLIARAEEQLRMAQTLFGFHVDNPVDFKGETAVRLTRFILTASTLQSLLIETLAALKECRERAVEECAKAADTAEGERVTVALVEKISAGDPESQFWTGYASAKSDIATALRAKIKERLNG